MTAVTVKERPILFSAPMVRALLDGRKTQTRRVVKRLPYQKQYGEPTQICRDGGGNWVAWYGDPGRDMSEWTRQAYPNGEGFRCPYGKPSDRLWVRETTLDVEAHGYVGPVYLESDQGGAMLEGGIGLADDYAEVEPHEIKLRPSIFMPRRYSRLTLEITDVRVERLQDISEGDAIDEGVLTLGEDWLRALMPDYMAERDRVLAHNAVLTAAGQRMGLARPPIGPSPRERYRLLWEQINGKGSWDANPWVWVVSFRVVQP